MAKLTAEREREAEVVVRRAIAWAKEQNDIEALGLAGSWVRGEAGLDSDLDLVLLTLNPERYLGEEGWAFELGAIEVVQTKSWGAITERRLRTDTGFEIDVGIGLPSWAAIDPVDAGTVGVLNDGFRSLLDPRGLLNRLLTAATDRPTEA